MKWSQAVLVFSRSLSVVDAQILFNEHYEFAKLQRLGPRKAQSANKCGLNMGSTSITYGRSLDEKWTVDRVATAGNDRVVLQEALVRKDSPDGSSLSETHLKLAGFDSRILKNTLQNTFVSKAGLTIAAPKLAHEDIDDANVAHNRSLASELVAKLSQRKK